MESRQRYAFQIIYGTLLLLAGVGVFFRIPQVMPKIEQIETYASKAAYIRICFYFFGCLLIGGGIKKIHFNYKQLSGISKSGVSEQ